MKKIIILISLFSVVKCYSQFTITYHNFIQAGDTIYRYNLYPVNTFVGNSGPNCIWDFSQTTMNEQFTGTQNYLNYPGHYGIPSITIGFYSGGNGFSWFHLTSDTNLLSDAFYYFSTAGPTIYTSDYVDSCTELINNFNFMDSYIDTFYIESHEDAGSHGTSYTKHTRGIISKYYDSYGELRLPWDTISNVARVKVIMNYTDSIFDQTGTRVYNFNDTGYEWYEENTRDFILSYNNGFYIRFYGSNASGFVVQTHRPLAVGIFDPEFQEHLVVFPNPVLNKLFVELPIELINQKLSFEIADVLGKCIIKKEVFSNFNHVELESELLQNGIYMLTLNCNEKSYFSNLLLTGKSNHITTKPRVTLFRTLSALKKKCFRKT
jgi:hypothetical protein